MTNTVLREPSELVEQLAAELQRWLDIGPSEQPHFPNGMRPFSTGDLKAFVAAIERLTPTPEPSLREALASVCRKFAAAWCALDFAHSEGFEWPTDPLGEEALAFADPTIVPEYAALSASPAEPQEATEAMIAPPKSVTESWNCGSVSDGQLCAGCIERQRQSVFRDLAAVLCTMPRGTLWCVGNMEDGPFARVVLPQPDGGYSGGYREAEGGTPADALRAALHALAMRSAASGGDTV